MKILFWQCDKTNKDACKWVYQEAKEQGYEVEMAGYRNDPTEFLAKMEDWKPDWIFSYAIRPHCLPVYKIARAKGIKIAISYHDRIFGSRVKMFEDLRGLFDVAIFSTKHAFNIGQEYAKEVHFLPQYFNERFNELKWKRLDPTKEIYDIVFLSFVGDPLRMEYLDKLHRKYNVLYAENLIGEKMTEAYAQSKIAVGLPRKGFTDSNDEFVTSNRLYNAMGSGCFYLSHYIIDIYRFFQTDTHLSMVNYDNYEEFEMYIDYYLENESTREMIAYNGQQEILRNHTLNKRVPQYMSILENFKE